MRDVSPDSSEQTVLLDRLWQERVVAVLRCNDQGLAADAMGAAMQGGMRILEFTLTIPGAYALIERFAAHDDVVVGAGTVLTVSEAERAVDAGARFLVSPVIDEEVVAAATRLGATAIPGTCTPTEMLRAHRCGAPLQKVFPAMHGGPEAIRAILGPMPFLRLLPTNGVDQQNIAAWLEAGAWAVGAVAPLFATDDLRRRDWDAIRTRAESLRDAAHGARRPTPHGAAGQSAAVTRP
jgi:Entner-Doudoroff aldolase